MVDCLYWLRQGRHRGLRASRGGGHRIELLAYLLGNVGNAIRDLRPEGVVLCLADVEMSWSDSDADRNLQERLCFEHFRDLGAAYRLGTESEAAAVCAAAAVNNTAERVIILSERSILNCVLSEGKIFMADSRLTLKDTPAGCSADKWIEHAALCGSASELSAGVGGIGPKGAADILSECASLWSLLDSIDSGWDIPGGISERHVEALRGSADSIRRDIDAMGAAVWNEEVHRRVGMLKGEETAASNISPVRVHEAMKLCGMNSGHAAGLFGALSIASALS